ncbi:MAG: hypothetical protein Q7R70_03970 [Candidatus Diapherotrites archaeon]|nr:hypothetical protein [Candidatus Diapherotrites archaeon]
MGLWDSITNLPGDLVNSIFSGIGHLLAGFVQPLFDIAKAMLTVNIDPFHFQNLWLVIITVISCFYLLIFLIVGFKFLFGSYDAVQRAEAKEWFKQALLLVIAVNASLLFYSLLLSLSSGISVTLWNSNLENVFSVQNLNATDLLWLLTLAISVFLTVITLVLRQIFLIIGVMLFPIGLFLYFIPPVKAYGSAILQLLGAAAFMNVLDVIILIAVQLFWTEFSYLPYINLLAPSLGFLLVGIANIVLVFFAVQRALSSAGVNVNFAELGKSMIGPAMMALA